MPCLWKTIAAITLLYYAGADGNQPRIIGPTELVIETGTNFSLKCLGDGEPRWSFPSFSNDYSDEEFVYSHEDTAGQSILNVFNPHFLNTGYYNCESEGQPPARVYVYIFDPEHPLVKNDSFVVVTGHIGENVTIPCRPTSPDINVTLSDQRGIGYYDPKEGFLLTNRVVTDSGVLTCKAPDFPETEEVLYELHINNREDTAPMPFILYDDLVAIQVGQDFNMTCEVIVDGIKFNLDWILPHYKDFGGRVKESTTVRKETEGINKTDDDLVTWVRILTIEGTTKEDEGEYVCKVSVGDFSNSVSHQLRVHLPEESFLNLTVHKPDIDVRTGTAYAQWMGTLAAHPHADLIWTNSTGGALYNTSKYEIKRTGTKYRLTIHDITAADAGRYFITARNVTLHLKLTVSGKPNVRLDVPALLEYHTEKNITCLVLGYPEPKVVWLKKDCDLLIDRKCDQTDAVPVSGDLISEFRFENRVQSTLQLHLNSTGELICSAENEEGSSQEMSRLKVTDVPEGFIVQTPDEIVEGDTVFFFCRADLYSISNDPQWYFAKTETEIQQPIAKTDLISLTKMQGFYSVQLRLQIKNITKENSGLYACQGTFKNQSTVEEVVNVTVHEPRSPVITYTNLNGSTVIVEKLEPVFWHCLASGMPTPTIDWLHNGQQIVVDNSSQLMLNQKNHTLILLRLSPQDEGEYTCLVSNRYGSASAKISLQILKKVRFPFYAMIAVIFVAAVMLIITMYLIWRLCKERKRRKELSLAGLLNFKDGAVDAINPALTLQEQGDLLPYHSKWEFPRNRLTLGKQLGAGTFGVVHKAEAKGIDPAEPSTTVAVKMVKRHSDPATVRDLASELKIMAHLGRNPHVVNLLGAVTTKLAERELLLIVEFCRFGNVRNYILSNMNRFVDQLNPATGQLDLNRARIIGYERNRIHFPNVPFARSIESEQFSGASHDTQSTLVSSLSPRDIISGDYNSEEVSPLSTSVLIGWSFQIARGMEWLASRKVLHGDLAARNILLADGNIVKICDFGLARSIYSSPEYQKTAKGPLPVKWMAVESIRSGIFSTQSDVWSYGVVLWELFSLARTPYPGFDNRSVLQMLSDGYRMEKPEFAPQRLYDFMLECWNVEPAKRPSFTDLACKLGVLLEDSEREHYLELEEEYRQKDIEDAHDYLSMVKAPNFDDGHSYVNMPPSPGYVEMDGENHELKPMLQPSPDDYLTPRDIPFVSAAVSNPSYEITVQKPTEKTYGKVGKSSVKENINLFESFRKKH